jgi:RNA polymerase sigma-70 factor (sigma-E family)
MLSTDVKRSTATSSRLGELYERYAVGAIRLAYLLTGDRALAEDLVQEAFVRLGGRLVHLRDPAAFEAYLQRTVVNLSHSHFRHTKVERTYLERSGGSADTRTSPAADRSVAERDELWRAMGRLSERQRTAIVLRFYEDLSEDRVAELLRCRPGTVKSLVSRGLQTMREEMRGEHDA